MVPTVLLVDWRDGAMRREEGSSSTAVGRDIDRFLEEMQSKRKEGED
jgi:hypothetical protein